MAQQQPDAEYQDAGVQSLCLIHTPLLQPKLVVIRCLEEVPEYLQSALHSAHSGDQMAGQHPKHRRTLTSWTAIHLHSPQQVPSPLAGPRPVNGGWQNTEGPALRGALRRFETPRPSPAALVQERSL